MSTFDVDGGLLLDTPKRGVVFGESVITPEGYHGKVVEFDEEGQCKVAFAGHGPAWISGWYDEGDLAVNN